MFFTKLNPMLDDLSLNIQIARAGDNQVNLTIIPNKGDTKDKAGVLRPISLTGTPEELDAEFTLGENGALGKLFTARRTLNQQIAEQMEQDKKDAAAATAASASKKKAATTSSRTVTVNTGKPTTPNSTAKPNATGAAATHKLAQESAPDLTNAKSADEETVAPEDFW